MEKYKIIFSDIDGTLLTSNHKVSQKNKKSIEKLKSMNIPFVLVSARMPKGINTVKKEINIDSPIICYSGGLVIDTDGNELSSTGIDLEKAVELKKYINTKYKKIVTSSYSYDEWIVDNYNNKWIKEESRITSIKPVCGNIIDICSKNKIIHKILCIEEADVIEELRCDLTEKFKEFSIYKSKDNYLEIMDKKASKASAMKILCNKLNINIEETIAVGDNYNDLDMIKAAALGAVMGNAPEEVKKYADIIVASNDNDGIAELIDSVIFK